MSLGIPQSVKDFSSSINGLFDLGKVQEIAMPTIAKKVEDMQTGYGSVPIELGIEPLEVTFTMVEQTKDMWLSMGLGGAVGGDIITLKGSQEGSSALLDRSNIMITCKGLCQEINLGTWKRGEASTFTLKYKLTQFGYFINDLKTPQILIDTLTNTFMLDGVDQLALRKAFLGII